jgi:hypothetical protein
MRQSTLVKEIMGKVVAAKSAINYANQNASFALFCYESEVLRDLSLSPDVVGDSDYELVQRQ